MFTKINLGQMPKWEKKLQSRWKQKKSHWKSIHMRVPLKLKIVLFNSLITIGHIPCEISRHVHFFIKTESDKVIGHVKSLTYRPSPIPSGGLEISLQLKFTFDDKLTLDLMNVFVKTLYDWHYTGLVQNSNDEDDDEEESDSDADFVINTKNNDEKNDNSNDNVTILD